MRPLGSLFLMRWIGRRRRSRAEAAAWRDEVRRTGWPLGSIHLGGDDYLVGGRGGYVVHDPDGPQG